MDRPELSVVILCYKAENYAPIFVSKMKELLVERNIHHELVLVANYDKDLTVQDKTPEIVSKIAEADNCVLVVSKPKEGMMGWDMRSGLEAATGGIIAVIDGDGQMPPEDVIRVYDTLISGNYDMAKTYRINRGDGIIRWLISKVYNLMLRCFFPCVRVKDANSKPKVFRRSVYKKLSLASNDWFIDGEMIIQASQLGFKIGEVSTVFYPHPDHRPSFIRFKAIFGFIKELVLYRLR